MLKIAAEQSLGVDQEVVLEVREYDEDRDKVAVEELEGRCEVGQRGKPSLVTDLMGDPVCRVRHFSTHIMLVHIYINTYTSLYMYIRWSTHNQSVVEPEMYMYHFVDWPL